MENRTAQAQIHDTPPTLQFDEKAGAPGFVNENIEDISRNDLEIMTREFIQNSLDAKAKHVVVKEVFIATEDMPGHGNYQEAFQSARKARADSDTTSAETGIVNKIDRTLKRKKIPVLLFIDDGHGITPGGMKGLLWGGNSTKGDSGDSGGSFGVGNRNAFKHSDLRYVCFASRFRQPDQTLQDICTGRAVLAAHPDKNGMTCSEEGLLVHRIVPNSIEAPAEFSVPDGILERWLKEYIPAGQTGSVIAVFGFNARKQKDWGVDICRAAAKNFYEAIHDERLTVNVQQPSKPPARANKNNIREQMANMAEMSGHPGSGLSSGRLANSGYKTYASDQVAHADANVKVQVRHWGIAERGSSPPHELSLSRNGMWIARSKDIPRCRPADFADCRPFNATISVRPDSRLYTLVKDSEGPKHLGLPNFSEVEKELGTLLGIIAGKIRDHVGEMEGEEEWVPPGFAVMGGTQAKEAEKLPDVEPPGGQKENDDDEEEEDETDDNEKKQEETDEEEIPDQRASQETPTGYEMEDTTFSLRPVIQQGVHTKLITSVACGDGVSLPEAFGVWVCWRTGSDASCDNWIPTRYIDIADIRWETADGKKSGTAKPTGAREVLIPASRDVGMTISLKEEIPEETAKALKIRVMRRNKGGDADA